MTARNPHVSTLRGHKPRLRQSPYRQLITARRTFSALRFLPWSTNSMFKASASVLALLLCFSLSSPLMAQTAAARDIIQSEKPVPPSNTSITGFAVDFLSDQKAIWTSPFHMTAGDLKFLAPAAVGV